MTKAWMRILQIRLISEKLKKTLTFGTNWIEGKDDLEISVVGSKYMSSLKDTCTIRISNLTYSEILTIVTGKFYDIEVLCGYRSGSLISIFKGGVLYISKSMTDTKTGVVTILCGSQMIAKFNQSRINLTLNSGLNMYAALNYVCKQAGIPNTNVSPQFKKRLLEQITTVNATASSWIESLTSSNSAWMVNTDGSSGSALTMFDALKSNLRTIHLKKGDILFAGGYPQLTTEGVTMSVFPTFSFMCGDTVEIDNSLIQIPVESQTEISNNYGYFLDNTGEEGYGRYMIFQINFTLQNRGSDFSMELLSKTRSLISNYIGG